MCNALTVREAAKTRNSRPRRGIALALQACVILDERREEFLCRMWLLGIAILHWVVFGLLVRNSETADMAPPVSRSLAALVQSWFVWG